MEIHCDLTPAPRWSMLFPSDFRSLKVIARGEQPGSLADAVAGLGRADGDSQHVYLDRAALVRLAGPAAHAPGWSRGFDGMLAYADRHGWTDPDGALRVHVEWVR